MHEMKFTDLGNAKRDKDGNLRVKAAIGRKGIQYYRGDEIGGQFATLPVVGVNRPEEEVFHHDNLQSFANLPITLGHPRKCAANPTGMVDSKTWRDVAVGETGSKILREGDKIIVDMIIRDEAAIKAVEDGTIELSAGYLSYLDPTGGITDDGRAFHVTQRNMKGNHIALVPYGRAGAECRLLFDEDTNRLTFGMGNDITEITDAPKGEGDTPKTKSKKDNEMPDTTPKVQVPITDNASVVVDSAQATILQNAVSSLKNTHTTALADKDTAHAAIVDAKDTEIETLTKENKKLKEASSPEAIQDAANFRVALLDGLRAVGHDKPTKGLTDRELMNAGIAIMDDTETPATIAALSDEEATGAFRTLLRQNVKADGTGGVKALVDSAGVGTFDSAMAARTKRLKAANAPHSHRTDKKEDK